MSHLKGLSAWLTDPSGTLNPTETNTMLCADNRYRDPNDLTSYFVAKDDFWSAFERAAEIETYFAWKKITEDIQEELIKGSMK